MVLTKTVGVIVQWW